MLPRVTRLGSERIRWKDEETRENRVILYTSIRNAKGSNLIMQYCNDARVLWYLPYHINLSAILARLCPILLKHDEKSEDGELFHRTCAIVVALSLSLSAINTETVTC